MFASLAVVTGPMQQERRLETRRLFGRFDKCEMLKKEEGVSSVRGGGPS